MHGVSDTPWAACYQGAGLQSVRRLIRLSVLCRTIFSMTGPRELGCLVLGENDSHIIATKRLGQSGRIIYTAEGGVRIR